MRYCTGGDVLILIKMARPARLELATLCLEGRRSIQLSYGRSPLNFSYNKLLGYNLRYFVTHPVDRFATTGAGIDATRALRLSHCPRQRQ
jgi:hypothetical protein